MLVCDVCEAVLLDIDGLRVAELGWVPPHKPDNRLGVFGKTAMT